MRFTTPGFLLIFKNLVYISFLLLGINYPMTIKADDCSTDSLLSYDYIYSICAVEPQKALELLKKLEELGTIPEYKTNYLRSLVYNNGLSMYRMALVYAQKVYQNDSIKNKPKELLQLIDLMVTQYQEIGNYKESVCYAINGIELARKLGNRIIEANFYLYIGVSKREMGLKKEATSYIDRAINIQAPIVQDSKDWKSIDDLLYSYGTKITFAQ